MKHATLGPYIRSLRIQNRMTQSQLAEKLNVTDKAVSKWEWDLSYPDIALFPKLADTLGVNVGDLLNECIDADQPSRLVQICEMSHDIRTPLHIILGCADMAEHYHADPERLFYYLKCMRISGEYLLKSFDRILQVANQPRNEGTETGAASGMGLDDDLNSLDQARKDGLDCDFSGRRILVAEDIAINREIIGELLNRTGAEVEFAEDGQRCVEKVETHPAGYFDLILMDILMPNMDGLEATRQIRRMTDPEKASIPIIAVSANTCERDRNAAFMAGMNDFTEKPIFLDRLFGMMSQYLSE